MLIDAHGNFSSYSVFRVSNDPLGTLLAESNFVMIKGQIIKFIFSKSGWSFKIPKAVCMALLIGDTKQTFTIENKGNF